jgi:hypothetical protein
VEWEGEGHREKPGLPVQLLIPIIEIPAGVRYEKKFNGNYLYELCFPKEIQPLTFKIKEQN